MKYFIASDIHGSVAGCRAIIEGIESEKPDAIILLGDLMYHGPRNSLPGEYEPALVADMLNEYADIITAVRGNCDSEVDDMMLEFDIMDDYKVLDAQSGEEIDVKSPFTQSPKILCTHGHLHLDGIIRELPASSIVLSGHTHIKNDETVRGIRYLNPGSVGIPRDDSASYLVLEDGKATFKEI